MKIVESKLIVAVLFSLSIINGAIAMESMMGNISLNNRTYSSLNIMGTAKLDNVTITDELKVLGPVELKNNCKISSIKITGPLEAVGSTINSGKVVGPLEAKDLKVEKDFIVVGPVNCKGCKFNAPVEIVSTKTVIEDSEMNKIVIRKDGDKRKQYLYLRGKTIVHGDVVVEQADAEVVVGKNARVEGKIIKGKK